MSDRAVPARDAGFALSAAGIALIAGRLIAGFALDYLFAPYVAIIFFAPPLLGIAILLTTSSTIASVSATVLVEIGRGAEVDLIAYLQSRYLGVRSFGGIYGDFLALFMVGSGIGPSTMGKTFAHCGTYVAALLAFCGGLLGACLTMLSLGPYPPDERNR
jgi:predicted MFS family arabinose efflux permease